MFLSVIFHNLKTMELSPGASLDGFLCPWVDLYESDLRWYLGRLRVQLQRSHPVTDSCSSPLL
jgi:hypothetical protein